VNDSVFLHTYLQRHFVQKKKIYKDNETLTEGRCEEVWWLEETGRIIGEGEEREEALLLR